MLKNRQTPWQFSEKRFNFKGRDILLKLKTPIDDDPETTQIVAKIVDFDEQEGLTVYLYKDKQEHKIEKSQIINARLYSSEI